MQIKLGNQVNEKAKLSRAFVFTEKEVTLDDMRKAASEAIIKLGFGKETAESIKYSRRAGCSCGCSPGFVLDTLIHDFVPRDIFITL